ncbi:AraC family transcriptional regulator [Marispirochaeta sp.]|jgi:AraC-like DNA-binding protein|uniref:AraC family transcriptional regulator n=1 Tax=Marispirochaeta sp. TaxID=2038653 RepID=UPI0029C87287|nr:AraC family transcriptional regulator [Marispirochaeta sp.]
MLRDRKPAKYTNSARYRCLEHLHKQSVELYLSYCGLEECDSDHSYGPTERSEFLLHYIIEGEGLYTVGKKNYTLRKHHAFLIYPDITTYYKADHNSPWKYIWIGFGGTKALEYLRFANFNETKLVNEFNNERALIECVNGMLEASQLTAANSLIRESYLMRFLATLIQEQQINDTASHSYDYSSKVYIDHAIEFIEHNFHQNIRIKDIADYIGINRSYLTCIFKKQLQVSPQEYLINFRMDKAAGLLKTTNLSINSVALKSGYEDPFAFSKTFKKIHGVSPKFYRIQKEEVMKANKKYE